VIRLAEAEAKPQARMDAEARAAAAALINRHVDSNSRIVDLSSFLSALAAALKAAREQGQVDASGEFGRWRLAIIPSPNEAMRVLQRLIDDPQDATPGS
jgi:hypothetical protein